MNSVTVELVRFAFPKMSETVARIHARLIENERARNGERAAVAFVRALAEEWNR